MDQTLARQAGSAFFWKGLQLAGNKLIFLVRTVILARILAPEDFGLMAITLVAVGFLTRLTELGTVPALIQSSDVDERSYNAAWTLGMVRAIAITAIVFVAAPWIAIAFEEPRATDLIRAAAIRPILDAASSIKVAQITRELRFRSITILSLADALTNTIVSIGLAHRVGVWALIAGTLAGLSAYLILSYVLAPHQPRFLLDRKALKPLVNFGRWIFLSSVIAVFGSSLLQLIISRSLGVAELGLYYLATKLAFIPNEVSSEVIGSVAFPLYSRLQSDLKQAARVYRSILSALWAMIIPASILLIALAPGIVTEILGSKWEGTAPTIQLLALVNIAGLLGDTTSPIFKGLGYPNKITIIEVFQSTLLIILIWSLADKFGLTGAALAWLIAVGSSQIISAIFIRQIFQEPIITLFKPVAFVLLPSIFGALLAVSITNNFSGLAGLILAGMTASLVTIMLLWYEDRIFHLNLSKDFFKAFPQLATIIRVSRWDL